MPKPLSKEEKLGIYTRIKANPALGLFQAFETLRGEILGMIEDKMANMGHESMMKGISQIKGDKGDQGDPGEPGRTPEKGVDYLTAEEIGEVAAEILEEARPKKGKDYFTEKEIDQFAKIVAGKVKIPKPKNGKTPVRGIDYPSHRQIASLVSEQLSIFANKKGKDVDVNQVAQKVMLELIAGKNADAIARALETLTGQKRLDYYSLKNIPDLPGVPMYRSRGKRLARGTGSPVKIHDLSAQLDSVTKSFTIPTNTRVLAVFSTSFPFSAFKPTTDYTSTTAGNLTFTDQIDAASTLAEGQTLLVLYVE